jgi:hypothetical protein
MARSVAKSTPNLDQIIGPETVPDNSADDKSRAEKQEYDNAERQQSLEAQRLTNDQFRQDMTERRKYAEHIFELVCRWLFAMLMIVVLQGLGRKDGWFSLADSTVSVLIGMTTASVLGLFVVVATYLFPKSNGAQKPKQ